MQANSVQSVIDWLINGARSATRVDQFVTQTCERLVECGLPLSRVGVFVRTLHPNMLGRNFVWRRDAGVTMGAMPHGDQDEDYFLSSPLAIVFEQGLEVRRRLVDAGAGNVPFFAEMKGAGATDYIALPLLMSDGTIHAMSCITEHADGFSEVQLADLRLVMPALMRMIEVWLLRRTAAGLLNNYVGARAGARILAGQIRRGHTETMHAAIWLSDLRGFTPLSDRLPPRWSRSSTPISTVRCLRFSITAAKCSSSWAMACSRCFPSPGKRATAKPCAGKCWKRRANAARAWRR